MVFIHRANDKLRAVKLFHFSPRFLQTLFQLLHCFIVIFRRHAIIQYGSVGDFAGQLHHYIARRADHDWNVTRLAAAMHHIQLDPIHMMEFPMKGDPLHVEQAAEHLHGLAHGKEGFLALDTHVLRQRIPPRADAANDPVRRQIVKGEQGGGEQTDVARPVVDDAGTNFEFVRHRGIRRHWHDRVAHQPGFCLPDGFKSLLLRVADVIQPIAQIVRILQIQCNPFSHGSLLRIRK